MLNLIRALNFQNICQSLSNWELGFLWTMNRKKTISIGSTHTTSSVHAIQNTIWCSGLGIVWWKNITNVDSCWNHQEFAFYFSTSKKWFTDSRARQRFDTQAVHNVLHVLSVSLFSEEILRLRYLSLPSA